MIAVIQDKTPLSPLTSRHHEKEDKTKRAQTQIPLDTVSLVHQTDVWDRITRDLDLTARQQKATDQ
jgi:hypothetical protein